MVPDDMIIISGAGKEVMGSANHELEVQLAIVKVLHDELGLDVITGHGGAGRNRAASHLEDASNSQSAQKIEPPNDYKHLARRPQDLGVIKVCRESLCKWLQKREGNWRPLIIF